VAEVYRRGRLRENGTVVVDERTPTSDEERAALEADGFKAISVDEAAAAVRADAPHADEPAPKKRPAPSRKKK